MYASDFEYAGMALSDYEMMICTFNRPDRKPYHPAQTCHFAL